jgi:hypothetical protein
MYGDNNHALIFSSTENFFNNNDDGVSLAYELPRNRLKEGTVALDSWLTLGQVTKSGNDVQFGVPKSQDLNGAASLGIGNNIDGLLKNSIPQVGIPLTAADGLMPNSEKPTNWLSQGFVDPLTAEDVSVFGNNIGNRFESREAFIRNSGTIGVFPDSNQILLAQITTFGDLKFEVNLEVLTSDGKVVKYVADGTTLLNDEILSPLLKFPPSCGCLDPNFLEYKSSYACNDNLQCKTPIVFGCMDKMACNFNANANYHVETLCCYIGYCNDIDLDIICPNLPPRDNEDNEYLSIYPNPVMNELNIEHNLSITKDAKIHIYNTLGQLISSENLELTPQNLTSVSSLKVGTYFIHITNGEKSISQRFFKLN